MPRVFRYAGGLCAVALALALVGGPAAAAAPAPDGPRLAFTTMSGFESAGLAVKTIGTGSRRPTVLLRGSRHGVVPKPLSGVSWSADGSRIAFASLRGKGAGIYIARANGTGLGLVRGTKGGAKPVLSQGGG